MEKNVNQNSDAAAYTEAIRTGKIETASLSFERIRCIQFLNLVRTLESRGIEILPGTFDIDEILEKVERRGISIPSVPYSSLSIIERRSLSDSLSGKTNGLIPVAKPKIQHSDKTRYLMQLQKYYRLKKV